VDKSKKNVVVLAICQALMMTCNSLLIAVTPLVGFVLVANKAMATLPIALQFLATMMCTLPASLLMKRIGRRAGFAISALIGATGAVQCTYAVLARSFVGLCAGVFLLGVFNAFGQYYRFAAADTATPAFRSRAISLVLAGGVVAAFAGPNLANWTRDLWGTVFSGSYASLIVLYAGSLLALFFLDIPREGGAEQAAGVRPLRTIARQPSFVVAVFGAMIAYGVMNVLMTSTPLAMHRYGHSFSDTAFVIQWHVFGMFAPSFFTGHLINRFGILSIMGMGVVVIALCAGVNLFGTSVPHFWAALLLLGLGWNFLFVGATTLLTETYTVEEKAAVQGVNDLLVFATVTLTAASAGALHHTLGWQTVNVGVMPLLLLCFASVAWLHVTRAPARSKISY
jgi:MFS family permease